MSQFINTISIDTKSCCGGMTTKLRAAKLATAAGADTYIINGASCENLYTLLEGRDIGTLFCAAKEESV